MKTIFKLFLLSLSMFIFNINVKAESLDINKKITNNFIIYNINNNKELQYSWQFNKNELQYNYIDINLELNFTSLNKNKIDKLINSNIKRQYLSFEYHGNLPSTALIKVKVDNNFKDGDFLYLYYYNKDNIKYITSNLIVKDGYVEFKITHCSDYLLTSSIIKNASDNPMSMSFVIVVMIFVVVILIAMTLFKNKR
ncbi:MAG: hypothetical protein PHQ89_01140 [Bacilli bacterium]|nr:hypothetical protein [Bacilli bacterium]